MLIRRKTGAGEDAAIVAAVDVGTIDMTGPVARHYSEQVWIRLDMDAESVAHSLSAFTDGVNNLGAGIKVWVGTASSYAEPAAPDEHYNPPLLNGVPMANLFGYTASAPLWLDRQPVEQTPGDIGLYLVLVAEATTAASTSLHVGDDLTLAWNAS